MLRRLAAIVIAAGMLWSASWFWQAHQLRGAIGNWFDARRADGWEATYDDLSIRGFPNRLDVTFTGLLLADPDSRVAWEAPFLQVLRLVYNPDHLIVVWPDSQVLSTPSGRRQITSQGLRASLVTEDSHVLRSNLEAEVLNIGGDNPVALAGLTAALEAVTPDDSYHIGLSAQAVATARSNLPAVGDGTALDGLRLDATVLLDKPLLTRPEGDSPQPLRVDLALAEYRLNDLHVKVAGKVDVDRLGRMDGRIDVKAVNWRALIEMARQSGQLPDILADTLEDGLSLVAGLSGNAQTLDLPLNIDDGMARLGPIPLGEAPRLRLP